MDRDKLIRLLGFIIMVVSIIVYLVAELNRPFSFIVGIFTGLGFTSLIMGKRVFKDWK